MTTGSLYFLSNDFTENIRVQNSFPIDELENWCHQRLVGVPQKYKTQEVPWQPSEQQPALQKTPNQHHYTKGTSGEIFLPNLMLKVTLLRQKPHWFSCVNCYYNWHKNSIRKVSIKTMLPPASLSFKGQATKHNCIMVYFMFNNSNHTNLLYLWQLTLVHSQL